MFLQKRTQGRELRGRGFFNHEWTRKASSTDYALKLLLQEGTEREQREPGAVGGRTVFGEENEGKGTEGQGFFNHEWTRKASSTDYALKLLLQERTERAEQSRGQWAE